MGQLTQECGTLLSQHDEYLQQGNIDKAVSCAQKAKDAYLKAGSQKYHGDYINLVVSLAQEYSSLGNQKKSIECYAELIDIFDQNKATDNLNYAVLCSFAADAHLNLGDMAQALQYTIKQMETLCKMEGISTANPPQNPDWQYPCQLATSLLSKADEWTELEFEGNPIFENLGVRLYNINELQMALQVLELTAQKMKSTGLDTPGMITDYIYVTLNLHKIYHQTGDNQKDLESMQETIDLAEKHGINNSEIASLRIQYASLKGAMGQQGKKRMDMNSVEDLIQLANKAYASSMFADAAKYGEKAIELIKKNSDSGIENYINIFNITGNAYIKTGLHSKAVSIYNELISITEAGAANGMAYAVALNNMATIYNQLKDYENEMEFRMKAMRATINSEEIPLPATQYRNRREEFVALTNLLIDNICQLKRIYKVDIATVICNNAISLKDQGYGSESLRMLNALQSKMDECLGLNNRAGYRLLLLLGNAYADQKEYSQALRFYEAAELTTLGVYGENSYERANVMLSLGNVHGKLNNFGQELEYATKAEAIISTTLGKNNIQYIDAIRIILQAKILSGDLEGGAQTFEYWLSLIKDQIRDYFSFMTIAEKSEYSSSVIESAADFVSVMAHKLNEAGLNKYLGLVYDFELLSKGLLLSSETAFNNYIRQCNNSEIQNLYAQYQKNGMLIKTESRKPDNKRIPNYAELLSENSNIGHTLMTLCGEAADLSQNISTSWQDVRKSLKKNDVAIEFINHSDGKYYALVLSADNKYPALVPLFDERDLKRIVYQASESDNGIELKYYESGALYANTWHKLEPYLNPGCNIYFAPKGVFHQIAVEYAPDGNGNLAFSKYNINRISSTRNLIHGSRNQKSGGNVCLYGGINYNYTIGNEKLNYLSGSLEEANKIGSLLTEHNLPVEKFLGDEATSQIFRNMSGRDVSLIHVATHGIFKIADGNSLDNSGLAMSDMVIKSSDISELDLSSTRLVVLSACETARGNVSGEGVFGLQRAFKLAGCQTLIMSLWPVNDYATQLMMTDFYNNVYEQGMTERAAFYKAIENLKSKEGTTPWHWAAFIMLD